MDGIGVFVIVLIVIWTLSGIANMINKQKEAERRRLLRQQLERDERAGHPAMRKTPRGPRRVPEQATDYGVEGFPSVLIPPPPRPPRTPQSPMPQPPRYQPQRQTPTRAPSLPRPAAKRPRSKPARVPAAPPRVMEEQHEGPRTRLPEAPASLPPRVASTGPRISAEALSRWLKPQTLSQQFVLTEIFQPPLALRDSKY